jgi:hypothetical protein
LVETINGYPLVTIIQLIVAHGKKIVVNMIPQMFYNYNMNGIVTKNEIDQKTIIELPSNFRQYYLANNVFIVNVGTIRLNLPPVADFLKKCLLYLIPTL